MADERKYYVLCGDNCKFESMTKEQIIAAIAEATGNTPTNIDDAFITKIKESNANNALKFWVGTQAEYNALESVEPNVFYIFTDGDEMQTVERIAEETAETVATEISNEALAQMQGICVPLWSGEAMNYPDDLNIEIPTINEYQLIMVDSLLMRRTGDTFVGEWVTNGFVNGTERYICTMQIRSLTFNITGENKDVLTIPQECGNNVTFKYDHYAETKWDAIGQKYGTITIKNIYGILKKEG